jgi:hypothetical protein
MRAAVFGSSPTSGSPACHAQENLVNLLLFITLYLHFGCDNQIYSILARFGKKADAVTLPTIH